MCPGMNGGKNFQAGAYSPQTNTMYYGLQNLCMTATAVIDKPDPTNVYGISSKAIMAPGQTNVGTVWAVSAETGRMLWKHEQRAGVLSVVATGGGLVFAGDTNGRFKALDDRTGQGTVGDQPGRARRRLSHRVLGQRQAVPRHQHRRSNVGTAANRMTPELKPGTGSNLFVFALP